MLSNNVLLSLSHITEVARRRPSEYLAGRDPLAIRKIGTSSKYTEALNTCAFANCRSHTNVCEALQLALIKFCIGANVDVIADRDSGSGIIVLTADSRIVL
jgi:hypothetical protein